MTASIALTRSAEQQYVLRLGDACLVLAQRLAEWSGHAPVLEEDIALSNLALDLLGQARGLLSLAGQMNLRAGGVLLDEDQLGFLRDERDYFNPTLAELPRGDFAFTVLRNLLLSSWFKGVWQGLQTSSDAELAAIAGKALKEARYHQQHAADWVLRLGGGTAESTQRLKAALDMAWRFHAELFVSDEVDVAAAAAGLGPRADSLHAGWLADVAPVLAEAGLALPAASPFRSTGRRGQHTEHMGGLLSQLQYLQRSFPRGVW